MEFKNNDGTGGVQQGSGYQGEQIAQGGESDPASTAQHTRILSALQAVGETTSVELDPQCAPSGPTLAVPLQPLVFPATTSLMDTKKEIYVGRNFADIFEHVCKGSGWLDSAANADLVRFVQVSGPPGSGKSLATFAGLRHLTGVTGRTVLYVSFKAAQKKMARTIAVLRGHLVYFVSRGPVDDVHQVQKDVQGVFDAIQPDGIFLDGCYEQLDSYPFNLGHYIYSLHLHHPDKVKTTFMGVTTSMQPEESLLRDIAPYQDVTPFLASPWLLSDYLKYAEALNGRFTSQQLHNLGCKDGACLGEVLLAIKAKFLVAGHSCRFMFDYTTPRAVAALREACNSARTDLVGRSEKSSLAINTLMVTVNNKCVPVSVVAAGMILRGIPLSAGANSRLGEVMRVAQKGLRPMLGWLFEEEVLDLLIATIKELPTSVSIDPVAPAVPATASASATVEKMGGIGTTKAQTVDSVADALQSVHLDPLFTVHTVQPAAFTLRRYSVASKRPGGTYDFPEACYIIHFKDDIDLVRQLLDLVNAKQTAHPVLCIPTVYAYPFLDFLLLTWIDLLRLKADSFQITISDRHSCDATVMQSTAKCMANCGLELTAVTHYAILSSARKAVEFQFNGPLNLELRTPLQRDAKTRALKELMKRKIDETDLWVFEPPAKEGKSESAEGADAVHAAAGDALGEEEAVRLLEAWLPPKETPEQREAREEALKAAARGRPALERAGTIVTPASDHLVLESSCVGFAEDTVLAMQR